MTLSLKSDARDYLEAMGWAKWQLPASSFPLPSETTPTVETKQAQFEALKAKALACKACTLHTTRKQVVFADGAATAELCIIGEAPGAQEDAQGKPFVGRAGQLLNAMLSAMQLDRQKDVVIVNVLKCRPPNNRNPHPDEIKSCAPFLKAQLDIIQPKAILALGRFAAQYLLQSNLSIGKLRGKVHQTDLKIPIVVTYHPAYLLRSPNEKAKAWQDCLRLKQVLSGSV